MAILSLTARLGLDGRGFQKGIKDAESSASKFGNRLKSQLASAFSVAAIAALTKRTVDFASRISDLSKATGLSVERLQQFEFAAKQSGASLDDIALAFKALSKARDQALGGDQGKLDAFSDLGITRAALASETLEKHFMQIAATLRSTDFGGDELALIEKVLGRAGMDLLPAFRDGFADSVAEAEKLGVAIESGAVAQLDRLGDLVDKFAAKLRGPVATAITGVVLGLSAVVAHIERGFHLLGSIGTLGEGILKRDSALIKTAFEQSKQAFSNFVRFTNPADPEAAAAAAADPLAKGSVTRTPGKLAQSRRAGLIERFDSPTPGGFGQFGGHTAGFISGFDPKRIVEEHQLSELQRISHKLDRIETNTRHYGGTDSAFRR